VQVLMALRRGAKATAGCIPNCRGEGGMVRDSFEEILGAMARAGLIRLTDETFEKDGRSIPYRRAHLVEAPETFELPH